MRRDGVSFRHAVELLRDGVLPVLRVVPSARRSAALPPRSSPTPATPRSSPRSSTTTTPPSPSSPEALSYLASRRIDHPEAITHFRLGYANRTLGLRLP